MAKRKNPVDDVFNRTRQQDQRDRDAVDRALAETESQARAEDAALARALGVNPEGDATLQGNLGTSSRMVRDNITNMRAIEDAARNENQASGAAAWEQTSRLLGQAAGLQRDVTTAARDLAAEQRILAAEEAARKAQDAQATQSPMSLEEAEVRLEAASADTGGDYEEAARRLASADPANAHLYVGTASRLTKQNAAAEQTLYGPALQTYVDFRQAYDRGGGKASMVVEGKADPVDNLSELMQYIRARWGPEGAAYVQENLKSFGFENYHGRGQARPTGQRGPLSLGERILAGGAAGAGLGLLGGPFAPVTSGVGAVAGGLTGLITGLLSRK